VSAPKAAAGRTCLRGQKAERAGLELGPGQGKPKAKGSGKRRWCHQHTPNLQTHDLLQLD